MPPTTENMAVCEAMLQVLRNHGVAMVFCSPGSDWGPMWEALAKRRAEHEPLPRYVNCRHEELAIAMAAGYTKLSGQMAAVLLHTSTGTLHGSLGIRGATDDWAPASAWRLA
jgi:acetolactate synthase I/II/III large subunit